LIPLGYNGQIVGALGLRGSAAITTPQENALQMIAYTIFAQFRLLHENPYPLGGIALTPREREVIRHGELTVNMLSREVTVGGIKVDLSAKEYQLLTTLASEPGRVFTKTELLETVWGFRSQGRTRTLDSHASRLRQKLRVHSAAGWLANEWGVGYRLCRPE